MQSGDGIEFPAAGLAGLRIRRHGHSTGFCMHIDVPLRSCDGFPSVLLSQRLCFLVVTNIMQWKFCNLPGFWRDAADRRRRAPHTGCMATAPGSAGELPGKPDARRRRARDLCAFDVCAATALAAGGVAQVGGSRRRRAAACLQVGLQAAIQRAERVGARTSVRR